jgi:nitronate monooxygenase
MIQSLFGTRLALIQAPMAGVQDAKLAASVSEAGGLGSLPCAMLSAQQLREQLELLTTTTNKPYNLNFFCHTAGHYTRVQQQAWQQLLQPYFNEFNIDAAALTQSASRQPINQQVVDIIAPYAPPVVSFHFGLPHNRLLQQIKNWGAIVISTATTVNEAKWLEAHGADAIIAQGLEAGGHRGHFLSMDLTLHSNTAELVKNCVTAVSVPVIAAGGINSADAVSQMQRLGAAGVQVGSAYLLCNEAQTSPLHREAILAQPSGSDATAITNLLSGRAARGIRNRIMTELNYNSELAAPFPYANIAITALRANAEAQGRDDFTPLWCGQNYIPRADVSAASITQNLMSKW